MYLHSYYVNVNQLIIQDQTKLLYVYIYLYTRNIKLMKATKQKKSRSYIRLSSLHSPASGKNRRSTNHYNRISLQNGLHYVS